MSELSLMEDEVVVTKRVVPRERVRLHIEIATANEPVEAILGKEEVALERTPVLTDSSATGAARNHVDA